MVKFNIDNPGKTDSLSKKHDMFSSRDGLRIVANQDGATLFENSTGDRHVLEVDDIRLLYIKGALAEIILSDKDHLRVSSAGSRIERIQDVTGRTICEIVWSDYNRPLSLTTEVRIFKFIYEDQRLKTVRVDGQSQYALLRLGYDSWGLLREISELDRSPMQATWKSNSFFGKVNAVYRRRWLLRSFGNWEYSFEGVEETKLIERRSLSTTAHETLAIQRRYGRLIAIGSGNQESNK